MKKTSLEKTATKPSEEKSTENVPPKDSNDYLEIRIPRLSFHNTSINVYLVFVLIIFSFLLGMLTNKVVSLEKQSKIQSVTQANLAANNAAPTVDPNATPTPFPKVTT